MSAGVVVINDRCVVRTLGAHRIVIVAGVPIAHYSTEDAMAEALAMVTLVEQGWADQNDVARAFGCSPRSVRRHQRRYEAAGLPGLARKVGFPKGRHRLNPSRIKWVNRLKANGSSNCEIARRLGVTEVAVRKLLRRLGWKAQRPKQLILGIEGDPSNPNLSAFAKGEPDVSAKQAVLPRPAGEGSDPNVSAFSWAQDIAFTLDSDPTDRKFDRLLACLGLLDDAAPLFRSDSRVPRAGVLLAVPALVAGGVFDVARSIYSSIGPAFYGLRTTVLALVLMALLRIKRPEALKEHSPADLGGVLGLDRAPEVKTLRRKLSRLARLGRAGTFGRALAEHRVATRGATVGFLFVDGHVRAYHGKRTIPKAHLARMRLSMPATTDYWVNDQKGDPLFVVTAEANDGLVKMLPPILAEVRHLVGERRVTIVFDRGGWSPKLFLKLVAEGFDILTYRKGRFRRVAVSQFRPCEATIEGCPARYTLADQTIRLLRGKLTLRQVTRLSENGHQTPIVTSRWDLSAIEVAYWMFGRWRQENFFKYLREEFALDALVDYAVEAADKMREVPNPARKAIDLRLREAKANLERLKAEFGLKAFVDLEDVRSFTKGRDGAGRQILAAIELVMALESRRARIPARVPVGETVEGEVIKLSTERKHLTNLFKMVAYQTESDLVRQLAPHYARAEDEGRTLIQSALISAADLREVGDELRVTLVPLSSPHRSRAIAAVCAELNQTDTLFPGTRLKLRFAVESIP